MAEFVRIAAPRFIRIVEPAPIRGVAGQDLELHQCAACPKTMAGYCLETLEMTWSTSMGGAKRLSVLVCHECADNVARQILEAHRG